MRILPESAFYSYLCSALNLSSLESLAELTTIAAQLTTVDHHSNDAAKLDPPPPPPAKRKLFTREKLMQTRAELVTTQQQKSNTLLQPTEQITDDTSANPIADQGKEPYILPPAAAQVPPS